MSLKQNDEYYESKRELDDIDVGDDDHCCYERTEYQDYQDREIESLNAI